MKIPLNQIQIGERQRDVKDLEDLSDLDSMADPEIGQLQPIGVSETPTGFLLIWGRRRLAKATALGWSHIEAVTKGEIPRSVKEEMELVEDIGRKDRSWQDKCRAMYKLFKLKQREKRALGESWTIRMMAALTGDSKTNANRMLQVGEELLANPEGPSAKAGTFIDAVKEVFKRNERLLTAELEKRRQATLTQVNATISEEPAETVPEWDATPKPEEVLVTLHVKPLALNDATPHEDFKPESFSRVIGYNVPLYATIFEVLKKDGVAVLWYDSYSQFVSWYDVAYELGWLVQSWPLVWNKITPKGNSSRPWCPNQAWGLVLSKDTFPEKLGVSSTVSVIETEPGQLHYHVVTLSLAGSPDNMPVLVLGHDANPLAVVDSGRTPVVFEPDEVKHAKTLAELKEHYEQTIPGVVINTQFK